MEKDLEGLAKAIDKFVERLTKEMVEAGNEIGELLETSVKDAVETQSLPLEGLTPEWAAYKEKHGLDSRVLISTGDMINSINFKFSKGDIISGHIGDLTLDSNLKWLALAHEYGLGTNRARPFISATVENIKEETEAILYRSLQKALKGS